MEDQDKKLKEAVEAEIGPDFKVEVEHPRGTVDVKKKGEYMCNRILFIRFTDNEGEAVAVGLPGRRDVVICTELNQVQEAVEDILAKYPNLVEGTMKGFMNSSVGYWLVEKEEAACK